MLIGLPLEDVGCSNTQHPLEIFNSETASGHLTQNCESSGSRVPSNTPTSVALSQLSPLPLVIHGRLITMLDTVRLGIPLTRRQFDRIQQSAFASSRPQWAILYPQTGELVLRRVSGLAGTDQDSFHREIRWDIPFHYYQDDTYLTVELSLPKLYYGHNIRLLYNFVAALELLKSILEKQFGLKGKGKLTRIYEWQLWRVDCCYAWDCCHSQTVAQQVLDSLKHLHFPRKRPVIYPTTILFAGTTYSLKFYLKLPEFRQHDLKVLVKAKASLEWISHCEELATGVLRVEATLRRKFLKKRGIETVADLLEPSVAYEFHNLDQYPEDFDLDSALFAIMNYHAGQAEEGDWNAVVWDALDGEQFNAPEGYEMDFTTSSGEVHYCHMGSGFILRKRDQPTAILQYLLEKFLGSNPGMQHADEVEAKLRAAFQDRKAGRLLGTWLCVQKLGVEKTKELLGKDAYYRDYRDMKKAGISSIELPKNVIRHNPEFWRKFQVGVPSEYVTNRVDDFRDGGNVLNLPTVSSDA